MKLMVCVKSCLRDFDRGAHDTIRGTWGNALRDLGIPTKFFVGQPTDIRRAYKLQSDEVMIGAKDDYMSLPYKTREICRWIRGKLVDYIYVVDIDTFIYAKAFAAFKYELYDYAGYMLGNDEPGARYRYVAKDPNGVPEVHENCYQWASGGYGYFLSQKAFDEVSGASPTSWAEDLWVGQVLGPFVAGHEMLSTNIPKNVISTHYRPVDHEGKPYDPMSGWMRSKI